MQTTGRDRWTDRQRVRETKTKRMKDNEGGRENKRVSKRSREREQEKVKKRQIDRQAERV